MQKIDQISAMHLAAGALQRGGQRLALIPTLGAPACWSHQLDEARAGKSGHGDRVGLS